MFTFVFTLVSIPLIYITIWSYIFVIITIVLSAVLQKLWLIIMTKMALDEPHLIRVKPVFHFFDTFTVYMSILASYMAGVVRAIMAVVMISAINHVNFKNIFSCWITAFMNQGDPVYASYSAMVVLSHLHNNPIILCFTITLKNEIEITIKEIKKWILIKKVTYENDSLDKN